MDGFKGLFWETNRSCLPSQVRGKILNYQVFGGYENNASAYKFEGYPPKIVHMELITPINGRK